MDRKKANKSAMYHTAFEGEWVLFQGKQLYLFHFVPFSMVIFNPIALRMAKTLWSFGHSECNRVKGSFAPRWEGERVQLK